MNVSVASHQMEIEITITVAILPTLDTVNTRFHALASVNRTNGMKGHSLWCIWFKPLTRILEEEEFVFVTYTIIQSITSSEICSLHLTHPSAHTPGSVGSRHCGARGAVGGSVPCTRVSRGQFLPEPRFEPTTSGYKSNIRPRLPCIFVQISEGSQCKEQMESVFLIAPRILSEDCSEDLFCKRGTVSWRVHKKTFVERWSQTAAASQTVSKWFHNALWPFLLLCCQNTHMK